MQSFKELERSVNFCIYELFDNLIFPYDESIKAVLFFISFSCQSVAKKVVDKVDFSPCCTSSVKSKHGFDQEFYVRFSNNLSL